MIQLKLTEKPDIYFMSTFDEGVFEMGENDIIVSPDEKNTNPGTPEQYSSEKAHMKSIIPLNSHP